LSVSGTVVREKTMLLYNRFAESEDDN